MVHHMIRFRDCECHEFVSAAIHHNLGVCFHYTSKRMSRERTVNQKAAVKMFELSFSALRRRQVPESQSGDSRLSRYLCTSLAVLISLSAVLMEIHENEKASQVQQRMQCLVSMIQDLERLGFLQRGNERITAAAA